MRCRPIFAGGQPITGDRFLQTDMVRATMAALLVCICVSAAAQTKWTLKKNEDGVKVYTGTVPNTNIKAIRAELIIDARLSQLAAVLLDMKAHDKWVYNAKHTYTIKQASAWNIFYYAEVTMPWPLTDRDVTAELNIRQDPATRLMYVNVHSAPNLVPAKKSMVRVPYLKIDWVVTPLPGNKLSVDYIAQADPGGSVPAWLVNSFSTKSPLETFRNLKALVATAAYKDAQLSFIKD